MYDDDEDENDGRTKQKKKKNNACMEDVMQSFALFLMRSNISLVCLCVEIHRPLSIDFRDYWEIGVPFTQTLRFSFDLGCDATNSRIIPSMSATDQISYTHNQTCRRVFCFVSNRKHLLDNVKQQSKAIPNPYSNQTCWLASFLYTTPHYIHLKHTFHFQYIYIYIYIRRQRWDEWCASNIS